MSDWSLKIPKSEALRILTNELKDAESIDNGKQLNRLYDRMKAAFNKIFVETENKIKMIYTAPSAYPSSSFESTYDRKMKMERDLRNRISRAVDGIKNIIDITNDYGEEINSTVIQDLPRAVFIVHGQDHGPLKDLKLWLHELGVEYIVLQEKTPKGMTGIFEKFEDHASEAGFAICILTADDEGRSLKEKAKKEKEGEEEPLHKRARQNIYLEAGYFAGKLGKTKVLLLRGPEVVLPSDLHGIEYVPIEGDWKLKVARALKTVWSDIEIP